MIKRYLEKYILDDLRDKWCLFWASSGRQDHLAKIWEKFSAAAVPI